jgi:DNA-binding MarR family transcriptional regulator
MTKTIEQPKYARRVRLAQAVRERMMYEKNTNLLHNLMWQLKEYDKNLGISASITELIFLTEVFKTEGTAMCNLQDIQKSTRVEYKTLWRHAVSAQKRGLITYETKFRNNKTKFIELTDEGDRLKARIIRLGSMTTFSDEGETDG